MIRKEIKQDGTFGGNYPFEVDYLELPEKYIEITKGQAYEIDKNIDAYRYIDNEIVNIARTQEYQIIIALREKDAQKLSLEKQIEELDKKRIRAICEPSVKDKATGQTWLEYYNLQIKDLRNQIAELE